jgi:hypothetical protein
LGKQLVILRGLRKKIKIKTTKLTKIKM